MGAREDEVCARAEHCMLMGGGGAALLAHVLGSACGNENGWNATT